MATSYDEIKTRFLFKTQLYNLQMLTIENKEEILQLYLEAAVAKFYKQCRTDLTQRDDDEQEFLNDLSIDEIDILAELMILEWLTPMMYSDELLESRLNTKDFTEFSPAKLIEQIRMVYDLTQKRCKALRTNYTYSHGDISEVNKS